MDEKELRKIIRQDEGLTIEFKRAKNALPGNLFESVTAFLNRNGGHIILGVTDDKKVEGVDPDCVEKLCKEIANLGNNPEKLDPPYIIAPQIVECQGKKLIHFFIPASSQGKISRMCEIYSGLPPKFKDDDVFVAEIPLTDNVPEGEKNGGLNGGLKDGLNETQQKVYQEILKRPGVMIKELSGRLQMPIDTLDKVVSSLRKKELIERRGSKKAGGYWVKGA